MYTYNIIVFLYNLGGLFNMRKVIFGFSFVLILLMSLFVVCACDADNCSLETNCTQNNAQNITLDTNYVKGDNANHSLNAGNIEASNILIDNNQYSPNGKIPGISPPGLIVDFPFEKSDLNILQERINETPKNSTLDLVTSFSVVDKSQIIYIHKNITIDGHGKTIDFGALKNSYIDIGEGNVIFKNINFINGFNDKSDNGGALYIHNNADVTLIDCSFCDNFARKSGGAVYCGNKNKLNIYNCVFNNNKAEKEKGGAVFSKGDIYIFNSKLNGNHAKEDGGAVFSESNVSVVSSLFESNTATGKSNFQNYGGAICCKKSLIIDNSIFKENKADDYGGAAYSYSSITVNNSNFTKSFFINNYAADEHGGALYAKGNMLLQNAVLSENKADGDGGAIYCEGNVHIMNGMIKNNKAGGKAGAVWAKSKVTIEDCVLNQNFDSKTQLKQVYSKNNDINIYNDVSKFMNSNVTFDNLSSVGLNKDKVNFWISNSSELKKLFEFISNNDPSWSIINITLAPYTVFNIDYSTFNIESICYGLRFAGDTIIFNGNPGSVIVGNNHKNNFIYACQDTNVFFLNTNLECFNHCIINSGNVIAFNSSFCDNEFHIAKRVKNQPSNEIFGGVIVNYNSALFENCTFVGNKAIYDGKKHGCWGSILFADSYSQTFLANCKYYNSGDDCFYANKYSNIILIQDKELGKEFKDCYINPEASLSAISYHAYKNALNYKCVINCHDVNQLKNTLYMVNSLLPGLFIDINLDPVVYEIPKGWINNPSKLRSLDWRDEFYHPSVIQKANKNVDVNDKFALDVTSVPITINGNGATIKVNKISEYDLVCFADVAYGGRLNLNNIKFSNFNHVFRSVGTIYAVNCTFENNKQNCGKPILWGFKSSTYFINCTFKPVDGRCADSNIFTIDKDSYINFKNCNFDFSKGKKNIGNAIDSKVECSEYLKSKIWFNGNSVFYNTDEHVINDNISIAPGAIFVVQIANKNYTDDLSDLIKRTSPNTIVMNITRDCEIDLTKLNFKGHILVNGNNFNVKFISDKGKSSVINKYVTLTINNITFRNYGFTIFENKGTLSILNCNFTNNVCKYLIQNEGQCSIINCTLKDNNNTNIFYNKKALDIEFCIFENNNYTKDALIYNDCGSAFCVNSTFDKMDMVICNYLSPNCVFINCSNYTKSFYQPVHKKMATWKKALIRTTLGVAVFILSMFVSYYFGSSNGGSYFYTMIMGGLIGYGCSWLDDWIIGGYEHDHSTKGAWTFIYVCIGMFGAIIGNTWGASNYQEAHPELESTMSNAENLENKVVGDVESEHTIASGSTITVYYDEALDAYVERLSPQEIFELKVNLAADISGLSDIPQQNDAFSYKSLENIKCFQ